jgi:hypothetical protein
MGKVVINYVVADEEISAAAVAIQGTKRGSEIATRIDQRCLVTATSGSEGEQATGSWVDLEVE